LEPFDKKYLGAVGVDFALVNGGKFGVFQNESRVFFPVMFRNYTGFSFGKGENN
jgi:hypothetical protein